MLTDALLVAALLSLAVGTLVGVVGAVWLQARDRQLVTEPALTDTSAVPRGVEPVPHVTVWLGLGFLTASLTVRWLATDRAPWANMYEFNQAFALAILGAYQGQDRQAEEHRPMGRCLAYTCGRQPVEAVSASRLGDLAERRCRGERVQAVGQHGAADVDGEEERRLERRRQGRDLAG